MWGGVWYAGLTYGGTTFISADLGLFNATTGLNLCFNQAVGYAGAWYAGTVYAGTPFCIDLMSDIFTPGPTSNLRDLCIIRCN